MPFILTCFPYPRRKPSKPMLLPSFVHVPGSMKGAESNYIMPILTKISMECARLSGSTANPTETNRAIHRTAQYRGTVAHTHRAHCHIHNHIEWTGEPPKMPKLHPYVQLQNPSHSSPETTRHPRAKQTPQMTILRGIIFFLPHTNSLFLLP